MSGSLSDEKYDFNLSKEIPNPFQIINILLKNVEDLRKNKTVEQNELSSKIKSLMTELNDHKSKISMFDKGKMEKEANILEYLKENGKLHCEIQNKE